LIIKQDLFDITSVGGRITPCPSIRDVWNIVFNFFILVRFLTKNWFGSEWVRFGSKKCGLVQIL